jgi:argininosuccinate lyase
MTGESDSRHAARLWDKGAGVDELVHRFTVGDDPELDRSLIFWDCIGSAAHAYTLRRADVLAEADLRKLLTALGDLASEARCGRLEIPAALEDCHTFIETELTRRCGDAGRMIHTGRSRNDQIATAMRLFMRHRALEWIDALGAFVDALDVRIERDGEIPMPGYTHLQPAMPSSIGLWLHASAEAALEQHRACLDLLDRLDACPLGTAAGFGSPIDLDRAYTAELLGFTRVQRSPIDVQNARGRMEQYFVRVAVDIGGLLEKLAWDLVLWSAPEYGFLVWPDELTTGSSMMPQKKNPDVAELMRGRAARLRGALHELAWVAGKLPSSYHRDLQLTKGPALRAAREVDQLLAVGTRVIERIGFDPVRLRAAMRPELYATHAAIAMVHEGAPFREAYRRVAEDLSRGALEMKSQAARPEVGRVNPADLQAMRVERSELGASAAAIRARVENVEAALLPATIKPTPTVTS